MRIAILLLVIAGAAEAAGGGRGGSFAAGPAPSGASSGFTRGGGSARVPDPRHPGELDPKRKINEQDCSKPVDLTAGNLKCK